MTTLLNELAQSIMAAKYYASGETCPEDVFRRVSKIAAIPDVIDYMRASPQVDSVNVAGYPSIFAPYADIAQRAMNRRFGPNPYIISSDHSLSALRNLWDSEANKYYEVMASLQFMPGTPTLINAGRPTGMLSSCFFLRIPDSMEGIFETVKQVALISKAGGGVGLDLSELRPAGTPVSNTNGTSSGPISFLRVFNETGNQVQQGGVRRAAMIAILRIDHPDIINFIKAKQKEGELSNFNISILVTDEFMQRLEDNPEEVWATTWNNKRYAISIATNTPVRVDGETRHLDIAVFYRVIDVWNLIVSHAWNNGEPGIIFWDEMNRGDIFKGKYGKLGCNPCGEQPLLPYESCNLAAINLANMYRQEDDKVVIDLPRIARLTALGIRFLDNIIDVNKFPLNEIEEWTLKTRRVGLGTMGLHDLMLHKGIRYGSEESLRLIDLIYGEMAKAALEVSTALGKQRGVPEALSQFQRRNSGLLTIQPTGTISTICNQASSGIEPVFQWEYTRKDSYGTHIIKHFLVGQLAETEVQPSYAVTALDVRPQEHVKVQAQVQKYIDSSISKTVNLSNNATRDTVEAVFRLAYKTKCKSVTVYRSGSRQSEVLVKKAPTPPPEIAEEINEEEKKATLTPPTLRQRPRVLFGCTFKVNTPGGKAYITVNEDKYGVREVFVHISKAGSEITTHVEAEGRLISHSLKYGIPADTLIQHLAGHKSNPIFDSGRSVKSVPDAVAQVMQEYKDYFEGFSEFIEAEHSNSEKEKPAPTKGEISGELCPDCGEVLYYASGCTECTCGYSRCG